MNLFKVSTSISFSERTDQVRLKDVLLRLLEKKYHLIEQDENSFTVKANVPLSNADSAHRTWEKVKRLRDITVTFEDSSKLTLSSSFAFRFWASYFMIAIPGTIFLKDSDYVVQLQIILLIAIYSICRFGASAKMSVLKKQLLEGIRKF